MTVVMPMVHGGEALSSVDTRVFFSTLCTEGLPGTNMRSAAKPWSPVTRAGSHGVDRPRPLPVPSPGMKSSKSSTSLAFESRLSKVWMGHRAGLLGAPRQ